jgi:hypothetical protein
MLIRNITGKDPRWQIGEGIRIPELCDFRKHFETW